VDTRIAISFLIFYDFVNTRESFTRVLCSDLKRATSGRSALRSKFGLGLRIALSSCGASSYECPKRPSNYLWEPLS
jgi:hypothetical protein